MPYPAAPPTAPKAAAFPAAMAAGMRANRGKKPPLCKPAVRRAGRRRRPTRFRPTRRLPPLTTRLLPGMLSSNECHVETTLVFLGLFLPPLAARAPAAAAAVRRGAPEKKLSCYPMVSSCFSSNVSLIRYVICLVSQLVNEMGKASTVIWSHGQSPHRIHVGTIQHLKHGEGIVVAEMRKAIPTQRKKYTKRFHLSRIRRCRYRGVHVVSRDVGPSPTETE